MTATYRRFVAVGDSTTEGLEDPDELDGYRGWADRLAEHVARTQVQPLEYANLAIRGRELPDIRAEQIAPALALAPDLMTIVGGVNDVTRGTFRLAAARAQLGTLFRLARATGCTVLTFTMPDPTSVNPLGRLIRRRLLALNEVTRAEADRYGVLVLDLERYPVAVDPRLWHADRLHASPLGHDRIGRGLAWRLGLPGYDETWAEPLPPMTPAARRARARTHLAWQRHHFLAWLGRAARGISSGDGRAAKRPVPTVVEVPRATPP